MATTIEDLVRIDGQAHEILKRVGNGSLDAGDVRRAFQSIIEEKFGNPELINEMFVPVDVQIANVRDWNLTRGWNLIEAHFIEAQAAAQQLVWPDDSLTAHVLVPYLDTVQRTFDELWGIAATRQSSNWRWDGLNSDSKHLRLLEGIEHQPGLRWETIDLGADRNARPRDVRNARSAHAGVLAAAAHFPKWVTAMDGDKVPYVWIPGYEATVPGKDAWQDVPYLYWNRISRQVELRAYWSDYRYQWWAAPVLGES